MAVTNSLLTMARSDNKPSHDEFAQLVIARLRDTGMTGEISYDPEEFQIIVAGETQSILFLGNAYQEYCLPFQGRPLEITPTIRARLA